MDELQMDKRLAPAWHLIEKELGQRPGLAGTALEMRKQYKQFDDLLNSVHPQPEVGAVENVAISYDLNARVYSPAPATDSRRDVLPVGVYFHGGGWCCGDLDSEDNFCRMLASTHSVIIVSVAYRLAPEHKAPAQICDAVAAWTWAFENAAQLGGDNTKYFTLGQSAGGTLAFAVPNELFALGRGHEIKGIVSLSPFTVHPSNVPAAHLSAYKSFETNANAPMNTAAAMNTFYDAIGASPADSSVYVLHSKQLLKFPPTYIAVCGADPLRDDGLIMGEELNRLGVQTKIKHYISLPHVFWAFACEPENGNFLADVIEGIDFVLKA